jgi:hypothetical protein
MSTIAKPATPATTPSGLVEGDHSPVQGIMTMLNLWLSRSIAVLNLFDSLNKTQLRITGQLQTLGLTESTQIGYLSLDLENFITQNDDEYKQAYDINGPIANDSYHGSPPHPADITAKQAAIADLQLQFNNQTSSVQTKSDIEKDTTSSIESEDSSLLQSIDSGLISILQNSNSIRLN